MKYIHIEYNNKFKHVSAFNVEQNLQKITQIVHDFLFLHLNFNADLF